MSIIVVIQMWHSCFIFKLPCDSPPSLTTGLMRTGFFKEELWGCVWGLGQKEGAQEKGAGEAWRIGSIFLELWPYSLTSTNRRLPSPPKSKQQFTESSHVPHPMWYTTYLILITLRYILLRSPQYRWGNWGTERWSNLAQSTELERSNPVCLPFTHSPSLSQLHEHTTDFTTLETSSESPPSSPSIILLLLLLLF